ncbi:MAG: hypothetical protein Q9M45_01245 [Robiginitomaculum sp.]|nr:hypothetical protein [Robiginitomaculum sp.]
MTNDTLIEDAIVITGQKFSLPTFSNNFLIDPTFGGGGDGTQNTFNADSGGTSFPSVDFCGLTGTVYAIDSAGLPETVSAIESLIGALQSTPNNSVNIGGMGFNTSSILNFINSHTIQIFVSSLVTSNPDVFASSYVNSPTQMSIFMDYSRIENLFGPNGNGGASYGANNENEFLALTFMHEIIHATNPNATEEQVQEAAKVLFGSLNYDPNFVC